MEEMKQIELSIIIPHFNTPDLLERLLNSIPKGKNIQILVIDDNSDRCLVEYNQLIRKWESVVEFFKNDKDIKGAGTCRNIGLSHAKGRWILFADADDYFLDKMYEIVSKYFNTDYEVIYFIPTSVNSDNDHLSNRHEIYEKLINDYLKNPSYENMVKMKSKPINTPWSKLFQKDFIERNSILFDEVLYSNDIMFLTKVGCYSRNIFASKEKIYCVSRTDGSLTTQLNWDSFYQRTQEYIKTCKFLKNYYKDTKIISILQLTGAGTLYRAYQQHYGIAKYYILIKEFWKNGLSIVERRTLMPYYLIKQLLFYSRNKKLMKATKKIGDEEKCI